MVDISMTDTTIFIKLDKAPIPPARKALKDNGFRCSKTVWRAKRTPERECFVSLISSRRR